MKKLMLFAAVTIASVSAHASKARLNALQNAKHLSDIQDTVQTKPDQAVNYEAATVEFGGAAAAQEAEGGFIRKMGDSAWGLYLGRSSTTYATASSAAATALSAGGGATASDEAAALNSAFSQDNSLQLTYATKMGSMSVGAGLFYVSNDFKNDGDFASNAETLTATKKQDVMGFLLSASNGTWDAQLRQGLTGKTEIKNVSGSTIAGVANGSNLKLESTNSTKLSGGYLMDTMYFYGSYEMTAGTLKNNGTKLADAEGSVITAGVINSHKKDGVDFFYGASAVVSNSKEKTTSPDTNVDSTVIPLIVGVEADVASWVTLRGALTQNLGLLSTTKTTGAKSSSVADSTVSTLGAGFKWGKATVDTVIGTGSTGTFGFDDDGDNFAQASITYNF